MIDIDEKMRVRSALSLIGGVYIRQDKIRYLFILSHCTVCYFYSEIDNIIEGNAPEYDN
jgi:hypothetical protein